MHFPYCKHLCNYCDFYKLKLEDGNKELSYSQFADYLNQSFTQLLEILNRDDIIIGSLETLYMGGGTPSLWGETGIHFIQKWMEKHNLSLAPNHEWTLEVDPGTTSVDVLKQWQRLGVNRFSVGIQTLNSDIFPLMDRSHNLEQVYNLLEQLKKIGANFSVDFMLGLPKSDIYGRSIDKELNEILAVGPNHLSLYFLTVPTSYKHFAALPDDQWIEGEYLKVINILKQNGFIHYEVASFAKPGFDSKHNRKYWTHQSVLALGPSATGYLQKKNLRYKWKNRWIDLKSAPVPDLEYLTPSELELEWVYLTLRQGKPFCLDSFIGKGFNVDLLLSLFARWQNDGLLDKFESDKYQLSGNGWLILDTLIHQLLTCK